MPNMFVLGGNGVSKWIFIILMLYFSVTNIHSMDSQQKYYNNAVGDFFASVLFNEYSGVDDNADRLNLDELHQLMLSIGSDNAYIKAFTDLSNHTAENILYVINNTLPICLNSVDIFHLHNISGTGANYSEFCGMLPTLIYSLRGNECKNNNSNSVRVHPPPAQVWGYGFLCVTLINLCALFGVVFFPLKKTFFYKKLLMFMVALGVGTLTGSSLLFLIPECLGLNEEHSPHKEDYIWKCTVIIGGIYLFFLTERILQAIMDYRHEPAEKIEKDNTCSVKLVSRTRNDSTSMNMSFRMPDDHDGTDNPIKEMPHNDPKCNGEFKMVPNVTVTSCEQSKSQNGIEANSADVEVKQDKKPHIRTVAWMVIFGDGLHNFIDGLSIGAAFSKSILAGVSISLAVICEELPHELGDFAILLNAGMSVKQALICNFSSACTCYLGLIFGIFIGEMTTGSTWIFAIAGGMFLYISLVDMLPEVNHAAEEETKQNGHIFRVFLIQNAGLLSGYGLMLFLAQVTTKIDLESSG